jgi:hypothetical protein
VVRLLYNELLLRPLAIAEEEEAAAAEDALNRRAEDAHRRRTVIEQEEEEARRVEEEEEEEEEARRVIEEEAEAARRQLRSQLRDERFLIERPRVNNNPASLGRCEEACMTRWSTSSTPHTTWPSTPQPGWRRGRRRSFFKM